MAVKTIVGKVLLKRGRVSCQCCKCCLYPAQQLYDGIYSVNDLPDQVEDFSPEGSQIYNKLDPPVSENSGLWYYEATGEGGGVVERLGLSFNEFNGTWYYQGAGETTECLFEYPFPRPDPPISGRLDNFAETYSISGPVSDFVTRKTLCLWVGEKVHLTNYGYRWQVDGNKKYGDQNTPVGKYDNGFTVA